MLLSVIDQETGVTSSTSQVEKKSSCLYFPMTQSSCFFKLILSPKVFFFSVLAITMEWMDCADSFFVSEIKLIHEKFFLLSLNVLLFFCSFHNLLQEAFLCCKI